MRLGRTSSRAYGEGVAYGIHQGTVLLAYDGSEHSKTAIRDAAAQLGQGRYAIVLTVGHEEARKLAAEGAELARSVGFDAMPLAETGAPIWRRIVEVADAVNASLLVLGSHGRSGIRRLLPGGVASAIASHTDRDVLIVHGAG
jgi:nucleotide-binding universal stress UspA family protein